MVVEDIHRVPQSISIYKTSTNTQYAPLIRAIVGRRTLQLNFMNGPYLSNHLANRTITELWHYPEYCGYPEYILKEPINQRPRIHSNYINPNLACLLLTINNKELVLKSPCNLKRKYTSRAS